MPGADEIERDLATIRQRVADACERSGRSPSSVTLVAAAKGQSLDAVRAAVRAGLPDIGHNYVGELRRAAGMVPGARLHFIGSLQSGSAHHVAALAEVVQTLAGGRATERLARRAAEAGRSIGALIEVDFTGRRSGVAPGEAMPLADRIARLDGLRLQGLMTIPPLGATAEDARPWFAKLLALRDAIREHHPKVVDLSMGMSLDYEAAIEEGATMVRIGTALFGARPVGPSTDEAP